MKRSEAFALIATILAALLGLIFLDLEPTVRWLASIFNADLANSETSTAWLALFLKVIVLLLLFVVLVVLDIVVFRRRILWRRPPSTYSPDDVAKYLRKRIARTHALCIVGYSLSYAEPLRIYLDAHVARQLDVTLCTPDPAYIRDHCEEDRPIEYRISHLEARLHEWRQLATRGHINSIALYSFRSPPNETAILFDTKTLFLGHYPLEHSDGRHILHKNPLNERRMIRLRRRDGVLFRYGVQLVASRKETPMATSVAS